MCKVNLKGTVVLSVGLEMLQWLTKSPETLSCLTWWDLFRAGKCALTA